MRQNIRTLLLLTVVIATTSSRAAQVHVSLTGKDLNPGSSAKPVRTLEAARDKVRGLRAKGETGDVHVIIQTGTYHLDQTLILSNKDSAPEGAKTMYRAAEDADVVLSGGKQIENWHKLVTAPNHLPSPARGNVWVAELPWVTPETRFHALMLNGEFLPRARGEVPSIRNREKVPKNGHNNYLNLMKYRVEFAYDEGLRNWPNMADIELFKQPTRSWLVNYIPLGEVDVDKKEALLSVPATYTIGGGGFIENAIDFLDEPGEWVLNTIEKKLYYWPKAKQPEKGILATHLDEVIRVEGVSDASLAGTKENPVRGLVFSGLTFSHADRQRIEPNDIGIQHDWDMWDKDNGLIRFRSAKDCMVRACEFLNSGSDGVRLDLFCQNITVTQSRFDNLGGVGVLLAGYGPGLKDVNHSNTISENHITRTGQLFWHSPAIFISQSGKNLIQKNHIHELGYTGIVVSGVRRRCYARLFGEDPYLKNWNFPEGTRENMGGFRWDEIELKDGIRAWSSFEPFAHARGNIIEYNEIHDCMKILHDGNAIYLSANGDGNVVRHNVLYNHPKGAYLRTDDDSHGVIISGNLIFANQSDWGIQIKGLNVATNNILVNGTFTTGGAGNTCDPKTIIKRNMLYHTVSNESLGFHQRLKMLDGTLDANLYWHVNKTIGEAKFSYQKKQTNPNRDKYSLLADPQFASVQDGDFSFTESSPADRLGIKSFPADFLNQVAPPSDPFRVRYLKNFKALVYPETGYIFSKERKKK